MNIYIPISDAQQLARQTLRHEQIVPNPANPPRKVEVQVSIGSNLRRLKQNEIEQYVFWYLMRNGVSSQMEQSLGMSLFSFEMLHGKRSSVLYEGTFIGKYTFLDRRGFGVRPTRIIAQELKRNAVSFERAFSFNSPRGQVNIVQRPLLATLGTHFHENSRLKMARERMIDVNPRLLTNSAQQQAA